MFGIGTPELLVILVVALVVLGPQRLPEVARALGKGLAELRKATSGITSELNNARAQIEEEIRAAERAKRTAPKNEATVERSLTGAPPPAPPADTATAAVAAAEVPVATAADADAKKVEPA